MAVGGFLLTVPQAALTASGVAGTFHVRAMTTLAIDVSVTAASGVTPTLDVYVERLGNDNVWYTVSHPAQITAVGAMSLNIGPGCTVGAVLTDQVRLRWLVAGTTPSFTVSASVYGRTS